jgi:peptidyl-prolyl cis-trans isomerase D
MLKFLGGRKRSRNAVLLVFVGLMALSLIGFFSIGSGGAAGILRGTGGSDSAVAKVGSYELTSKELTDALRSFGQQVAQGQGQNRQDDLKTLYEMYGTQVLDSLIRQKLVLYEADQLNLGASDSEVQSRLKQIFNPWPGPEQYRMRLQQGGLSPVTFEENLRASIAQEHLRSFITAAVEIDPKAVEDDYRRSNTTYSVRWVEVDPQKLRDKVQVNDTDLRAYFDGHKDDFKVTSEQRRARYVFIDQTKAGEAIQVSDDELKQDFDPERMVKQVRVSQIVLDAPKPPTKKDLTPEEKEAEAKKPSVEEAIRAKAQDISKRAQGSEGKPAEDFAKLARENSQDQATRSRGGDLGWINKDEKRDTDDPLNRVFNMKKDEVSQPIKKGDKYYVLKVTDRKIPTLADAREDLLKAARSRRGYSKAVEIATEAEQNFKQSKDANAVAADINKKYGADMATVKDVPFFSEGDTLPGLGSASEFETTVFELQNPNDVGDRINVDKGFAIPQFLEKRDPHDAVFEDSKDKVEKAYRAAKAAEMAEQRAKEITKAKSGDELKKMGEALGMKVDERSGLGGSDSIGVLVSEATRAPIYKLNVGEITKEPIKTDNNVYVVALLQSRKDPDMGDAFQKARKSIEQRLLDERRNVYFSTYLAMTQKQLTDAGKIKIYEDVIAAAVDSGTSATSPSPQPGMPTQSPTRPRRSPTGPGGVLPGKR